MKPLIVRTLWAVPLIALIDGLLMGQGEAAYQYGLSMGGTVGWSETFLILFPIVSVFALITGLALASVAIWFGKNLPEPKLLFLILIGIFLGSVPFLTMENTQTTIAGLLTFSMLGAVSGILRWQFVEKHRVMQLTQN